MNCGGGGGGTSEVRGDGGEVGGGVGGGGIHGILVLLTEYHFAEKHALSLLRHLVEVKSMDYI